MEDFDALRREATKLERHLEDKVAKYQQLAQRVNTTTDSLLSSAEAGIPDEEVALQQEIQRCLANLSDLIQQRLGPAAERSGKSQHLLLVKRYREILFDLTGDFQKTTSTLNRKRQHAELLSGANENLQGGGDQDPAMEQLLRERNAINNSMAASQGIVDQATDIYGDLRQQGMSLGRVSGSISRITANIPGLNRLVDNIRKKRSRDDMIVAGVIAFCILFTLWYIFG